MLLRIFTNMQGASPLDIIIQIITTLAAVVICLVVHELCHGLAAHVLGDPTPKRMGRLTLNPVKHIDPIGGLMLLVVGFGWARPVQVDVRYFKHPKRDMALTAFAGPVSNFIMAFLFMGILVNIIVWSLTAGTFGIIIRSFLQALVFLNIGLGVFNLIPIPPLDGSKILASFLPDRLYWRLMQIERYGMFVLIAFLIFFRDNLGRFITNVYNLLLNIWM